MDFSPVWRYWDLLLLGLWNSVELTVLAYCIGLVIGIGLALVRLYGRAWAAMPIGLLIDFFRCTPSLVQLFWFFFAMPRLTGIRLDPFGASLLTLSILSAAFVAEVFRGGIVSIDRGQWDAAKAIGMSRAEAMRRVILPQAVKRMIPVFLERAIELFKTSTIASVISYQDILFQANEMSHRSYRPLEIFTVVALIFLIVITIGSQAVRRLEKRLAVSGETTTR